ncbi:MAG: phosphoglyceromutase [Chloroflexi bacterium]|uniref:Metalloenzyme n=1 Tax=Candidatus Chlorohelix allophototropha TaxID=3003348 RepID=A0A8T7M7B4_9CHLR|nr:phosphoglyceromutase [Chloroflexota bacterium]WJW69914.1 metalloenzyme [Chloroflexota bacterium L227-S17]
MQKNFIFLFLDGVGLGTDSPENPLAHKEATPFLNGLLGSKPLSGYEADYTNLLFKSIDAQLGIPGLPQSATGQAALYTGQNAPAYLGRHMTGFANGSLRVLIEESGIFKQAKAIGAKPTHANLYSQGYFRAVEQRRIRYSVGTLVGLTAGVPFRMPEDYERGEAVFWDITGERMPDREVHISPIAATEAGKRLANIGGNHNLTLFECYLPDFAGHSQNMELSLSVLQLIDRFLNSVIQNLSGDTTLLVTSDHGNVEDLSTKGHTYNPVPLLVVGPDAGKFRAVKDITGLTPKIIELLGE